MFKNVAGQKIAVFAWDNASGAPKTGDAANISAQISIDGGTTAATNDTAPTELDATDAPGIYLFDMTQAESNGDLIILSAVSSTADIDLQPVIIYTRPVDSSSATSGGSVNIAATQDNTSGAIDPGSTTKVWATVSGTFADTEADAGTSHDFTDTGDVISHVYGFNVGGGRLATAVQFLGNVDGNNDEMQIEVWDHVGGDWEVIGTIEGSGGNADVALDLPLLLKHTGTSATEIGKVYIQMDTNSTTPSDLSVKLLLVSAVNIGQSVGYEGGRIWINTGGATNTNTESFVDGVADNTVSTIGAAKTISANTGLSDFQIINGSTITLGETSDNESYFGDNWTLVLNGQSCASAHFEGAAVSGIQTGANCGFHGGEFGDVTLAAGAHLDEVGLGGTITLPVGSVEIFNCHHDGDDNPILDFGAAVGSTTVHAHNYHGALEVQNMGDSGTDILHLDGDGTLTVNANSSGGTIHLRGSWKVTNNVAAVTISVDDLKSGIIYGTAETGTLSTTKCTSSLVGFTNDQLIDRAIIFVSGPADGEAKLITDYDSVSGLITFNALTLAPENNDLFKIV